VYFNNSRHHNDNNIISYRVLHGLILVAKDWFDISHDVKGVAWKASEQSV